MRLCSISNWLSGAFAFEAIFKWNHLFSDWKTIHEQFYYYFKFVSRSNRNSCRRFVCSAWLNINYLNHLFELFDQKYWEHMANAICDIWMTTQLVIFFSNKILFVIFWHTALAYSILIIYNYHTSVWLIIIKFPPPFAFYLYFFFLIPEEV